VSTEDGGRGPGLEPGSVNDDGDVEVRLGSTVAAGGDGIGRLPDGRVVFVPGGLPGERVAVSVTEERRDYARAALLAVVDASPGRVEPPCPWVAHGCGGCGWQHASISLQADMRASVVLDSLRRLAHVEAETLLAPTLAAPAGGYRTTVHLALDGDGRPCYHRRGSERLVGVEACGVAHPRLAELIDQVRLPGTERVTLRVGVAGGERLVVREQAPPPRSRSARDRRATRRRPAPNRTGPEEVAAPTRTGPERVPEDAVVVGAGRDAAVHEEVGGRRWRVSARSFFQSGPLGAGLLADAVDEAVGPLPAGGHLVDLYAGVGLLGGVVASRRSGIGLTAVESDPSAAGDATVNLADVGATVALAEVAAWSVRPADAVIADPARPGLGRPGVAAVAGTGARRVVLVSCDPASLARDVGLLAEAGYLLGGLRIVDLFPHTPHVETVSWFDRPG
jgi:23S rRNA (uracil1939-C5)-methyltransferase